MNSLPTILPTIQLLLQDLAQDSLRFNDVFEQSFGNGLNQNFAETLRNQWASGDFSQLPAIEILESGMNGALGAYASSTNTIYLAQFLVDGDQPELLSSVLLEEIGHSVDAKVNTQDTVGDEGFLFSALVQGKTLSLDQWAATQGEDDAGFITVKGQSIAVEMATWTVSTFAELQNALTQSKTNGTSDIINLTADIRLTSQLPLINEDFSLTINGNNHTINGDANNSGTNDAGDVNLFFVKSGTVTFNNLILTGGRAQGTGGAGGGAGMGGALFIYGGNVTLNNTTMSNNQAIGGNGYGSNSGGGMGLGVIRNPSNDGGYGYGGYNFGGNGDNGGYGGHGGFGGFGGGGGKGGGGYGGYSKGGYAFAGKGFGGGGGFGGFGGGDFGGSGAGMGGAIFIRSGSLSLIQSGFINNSTTGGVVGFGLPGGGNGLGLGGAIFAMKSTTNSNGNNQGMPTVLPTVSLNNVSFSGNNAGDATGNVIPGSTITSGTDFNNDDLFGNRFSTISTVPAVTLTVTPASVLEDGTTNLVYTFTRTSPTTSALTVNYGITGTADATDYTGATPGTGKTITFAAGSATATLTIDPTADTTIESNETVAVTLATGTGYTVGTTTAVTGTITNDDLPSITLAVAPTSVTEDGTTNLVYTFTRTGPTTSALTVNYGITGTADATDYTGATPGTGKTITFAANSATATLTIDPTADTTIEANDTVALTLATGTGYTIGTTAAVTGTITNDDLPSIALAVAPASVSEDGTTNLVYTFTRTGPTTSALTVNYGITGTADATDYTGATPGTGKTITFAANSATATLTIDPTADTTIESNETVALTLATGTGYTVGTTTAVTGTITNDDLPSITLAVAPTSVTEDGTTNLVYTFTRTGATTSALTVNYGITGTADATDYTGATPGTGKTITFAANSATATLTIDPTADTTIETDETVALTLATGTGYTIGTTAAVTGTITNDDSPTLSINDITVVEGKDASAFLTISLSNPISQTVSVNYTTTAINATAGSDYTTTSGTLTIAPNSTLAAISIPILNDDINESLEAFTVTLSNPVNAKLNTNASIGEVIISDTWYSGLTRTLPNGVENLTLIGVNAINGTGNSGNNILTGNSANNTLNGSTGVDTLIGGLGNDIYQVDSTTDVITENANEGTDTIQSSVTFSLAAFPNLENLTLTGSSVINGTGNAANNSLTGNTANNTLDGGDGNDTLNGGAGNDSLIGGNGNDFAYYYSSTATVTVNLATGTASDGLGGTDTLSQIENIQGSNTAGDNLTGNTGVNVLYGYGGADILTGGGGNDLLYLGSDTVKDTVNYTSGDGADTVYNFVRGASGDVLKFTGITAIDVQVSGTSTLFKVGDGISGNSGFGTGTLLLTTSATTGFVAADVNVNLLGATFAFS